MPFSPGDTLLLYSDALIESPDFKGNLLNEENIISYFNGDKNKGFNRLVETIKYKNPKEWPDDLTVASFNFLT